MQSRSSCYCACMLLFTLIACKSFLILLICLQCSIAQPIRPRFYCASIYVYNDQPTRPHWDRRTRKRNRQGTPSQWNPPTSLVRCIWEGNVFQWKWRMRILFIPVEIRVSRSFDTLNKFIVGDHPIIVWIHPKRAFQLRPVFSNKQLVVNCTCQWSWSCSHHPSVTLRKGK